MLESNPPRNTQLKLIATMRAPGGQMSLPEFDPTSER
jgi:hypothetical protein